MAGLFGGPSVAIGAGLIAGTYRFWLAAVIRLAINDHGQCGAGLLYRYAYQQGRVKMVRLNYCCLVFSPCDHGADIHATARLGAHYRDAQHRTPHVFTFSSAP